MDLPLACHLTPLLGHRSSLAGGPVFRVHYGGLLAYYDVMITSGPLEGTNKTIKSMKRQAYGFRDKEFSKL
ncbi:MAG: transposase [Planctomycetaceae bacterium]|nr:transposase [Planctomycetaceae bacterium]